jgi:NAD+ synthase
VTAALKAGGAEILLVPNGSPFRVSAIGERCTVAQARVAETGLAADLRQPGLRDRTSWFRGAVSFAVRADGRSA